MADDVLGHEHLDHGKHLHKGKQGHGHDQKHDEHGEGHHEAPVHKPRHIGFLGKEHAVQGDYKRYIIIAVIAIPLAILFFNTFTALAIALGVIVVNALVEYPKPLIGGAPIDFEILSVGTAYLASVHGFLPAFAVVVAGPFAAELTHGHLSDFVLIKVGSLLITALAALAVGATPVGWFIAVLFGLVAQFLLMQFVGSAPLFANGLRRITNGALAAYLIFFLLARLA